MAIGTIAVTYPAAARKAALMASLLDLDDRRRLLASLPPTTAATLARALAEVDQQGWGRREIVEAALGTEFTGPVVGDIGLDELMALTKRLDSVEFSRLLVAVQPTDPEFVVTLLDRPFAARVRSQLQHTPAMPERLQVAVRAWGRTLLEEDHGGVVA